MQYNYNDNTLIHGIGFNPMKLEGILKYGIITDKYAKENNIPYSRNYNFTLSRDMLDKIGSSEVINEMVENANKENIYLVRSLYISDDPLSAYEMYIKQGISLIIEDVPFIYDKNIELIKRSDEVVVKNYIPKDKIKAIMVPEEYQEELLCEVYMLPRNILNYDLIKSSINNLIMYLKRYDYKLSDEEISYLLKDLYIAFNSVRSLDKSNPEYEYAMDDYKDIILDINSVLAEGVYHCFSNILGKEATVMDMVEFINSKYDNKEVVFLNSKGRVR